MAIVVKINGVNRNAYILPGTLAVQKTYGDPWTCDFRTTDPDGGFYPASGQSVSIEIDGSVYFGGIIRRVQRDKPDGAESNVLECTVSCTDWNQIFERRLAGEYEWIGELAGDIVRDIVTNSLSSEGFDVSLVENGPVIDNFRILYPTVAEAFAQLCKLSEYRLYCDQNKKIRFFNPAASPVVNPAAFDLPTAARNIATFTATETDEDYCNVVIGRVENGLRPLQTETFTGSSPQTTFELAFPVGAEPRITLDGDPQTVGITGVDTGRDWYWQQGSKEIRQGNESSPITGTLEVEYMGVEPVVVSAVDVDEVAYRAGIEGGSGRYERFVEIDGYLARGDAQAVVDGFLAARNSIPVEVTYTTNEHLEPQIVNLMPGTFQDISLDGWAAQQTNYFVRSIRADAIPEAVDHMDLQFVYTVEVIWGSLTKTVFQWFKDLAGGSSVGSVVAPSDIEYFHWFLAGCDVLATGNDIAPHWPVAANGGSIFTVIVHAKTPPSTAALTLDVKKTTDGVTWDSVFQSGSVTFPAARTTPLFFTNISEAGSVITPGTFFRVDVTSAGATEGLQIKMLAKKLGRTGSTRFDGSQATGIEGTDESTEELLILF